MELCFSNLLFTFQTNWGKKGRQLGDYRRCGEVVSEGTVRGILSFPCVLVCSHSPRVEANPTAVHTTHTADKGSLTQVILD